MTITLYGIPNCDQVKKARAWLDAQAVPYVFHDFKKAGITRTMIEAWLAELAWEVLINRKGTTWRALTGQQKAAVIDQSSAIELMLASPSVIKRPVLSTGSTTCIGYSEQLYQLTFKK
jgi:arsenate reductase